MGFFSKRLPLALDIFDWGRIRRSLDQHHSQSIAAIKLIGVEAFVAIAMQCPPPLSASLHVPGHIHWNAVVASVIAAVVRRCAGDTLFVDNATR